MIKYKSQILNTKSMKMNSGGSTPNYSDPGGRGSSGGK